MINKYRWNRICFNDIFSISVNLISIKICVISTVFLTWNAILKIVLDHEFFFFNPTTCQFRKPIDHVLDFFFPTMGMTHFKHAQKSHLEGQVLLYCSGVKLVVESVDKLPLHSHTLLAGKEQMQPLCLGNCMIIFPL